MRGVPGSELGQGWEEEKQVSRWINNCTVEQSAWLYHKFDNAQGSNYARVVVAELDAAKTMDEELVNIAQVRW